MMRNGLLLYTPDDAQRNDWFIRQLCRYAEPEGISLRLSLLDVKRPLAVFDGQKPDFILNRSRCAEPSAYAEEILGIPVMNSRAVTEITNDKYRTYEFLHCQHGIPMAETTQVCSASESPDWKFPLVAKPPNGHGGVGVTWLADETAYQTYLQHAEFPFLLQKPLVTGWDTRIYIMAGGIYAAVTRTSGCDFRSNFSLGGRVQAVIPDDGMQTLARRVQAVLPLDFAGIDLLRQPGGGYAVGEIEDAAGYRMLYQETGKNPARDIMIGCARLFL